MKLRSFTVIACLTLICAFAILIPTRCWSAIDLFILVDGIPGESVDEQHTGWIEGVTYHEQLQAIVDGRAYRIIFSPIRISTPVNKASILLRDRALKSLHINEVEIHMAKPNQTEDFFYKVVLRNVIVSAIGLEAKTDSERPIDRFDLNFSEIEYQYIDSSGGEHGGGSDGVQIGDIDEDGYTTSQGDCNDLDDSIYPGAQDICDGKDNNCDGQTDEDYPNLGEECTAGQGFCENHGVLQCSPDGLDVECNAVAGTGSTEICGDGLDNDCDGNIDNGCNQTPIAVCKDEINILADENCNGSITGTDVNGGSYDPDGDALFYDIDPAGPFDFGSHLVTLTVTDGVAAASCQTKIHVTDDTPPAVEGPADVTIECGNSTNPNNTGQATTADNCDATPDISYSDVNTPGSCPAEKTITRIWTARDASGNSSIETQNITVQDTTAPVISCNSLATITPPDAPISFTASAVDNCDGSPSVVITGYDCYIYTKKGKRIDKTESCVVEMTGDQITILDSGGVDDHIEWTVEATDNCDNISTGQCEVSVVNPAK